MLAGFLNGIVSRVFTRRYLGVAPSFPGETPSEVYFSRREYYQGELGKLISRSEKLSIARLASFSCLLFFLFSFFLGDSEAFGFIALIGLVVASLLLYVLSVFFYSSNNKNICLLENLVKINTQGLARIRRDWAAIDPVSEGIEFGGRDVSDDLGLFGEASLAQLVCNHSSSLGDQRVADWLEFCPTLEVIRLRQKAVAELRSDIDTVQKISAAGINHRERQPTLKAVNDWLKGEVFVPKSINAVAAVNCALLCLALVMVFLELIPFFMVFPFFLVNVFLILFSRNAYSKAFSEMERVEPGILVVRDLVKLLGDCNFSSELLIKEHQRLFSGDVKSSVVLDDFQALVHNSRLRFNPIPYVLFQLVFAWDVRVLLKVKAWHSRFSSDLTKWIDAISNIEACNSIAVLNYENPGWSTPLFSHEPVIDIVKAGNPLLDPEVNVTNDINIYPPKKLIMITGSNMAGKTTYMRTLGLNVKLALLGANVCAEKMVTARFVVLTSMHVKDSLKDGVSYFMAELGRVKVIIDAVRRVRYGEPPVLFLLDEILKGTNGSEREVAVVSILSELCKFGALGALTTHDVSIASSKCLDKFTSRIFFEEKYTDGSGMLDDGSVSFDYRAKPGIVKNTNALKLLNLVGVRICEDSRIE
ncbi:MutS-related protein [Microbulbifer sp. SA54]|uniref:MutS-related protein n=1 Tax=Microbulbifer sp. SA54 TaxID=3401577 RepID=UPI003AB03411